MEVDHLEQNWNTGKAGSGIMILSDVLLSYLFELLPVRDRLQLATCCSRLLDFLDSPDAWRSPTLVLNEGSVNSFSDRDHILIRKYGRYFRKAEIVVSLRDIAQSTLQEFPTVLYRRGAIKRVTMCIDKPIRITRTVHASPFSAERTVYILTGSFHLMLVRALGRPAYHTLSTFIDRLGPGTDITINFCGQHRVKEAMNTDMDGETGHSFLTTIDYSCMSEQCCSKVKKLVLPASQLSELQLVEVSQKRICNIGSRRGHCSAPTARLISKFSNLRELYIGHENVSNQLLQKVSEVFRKQTSLCRLVIRCCQPTPTPQLSRAAWNTLAKACPSLIVECHVHLPTFSLQFEDMIKPETPLVKVKIVCHNCRESSLLTLFNMCQLHTTTLKDFTLCVSENNGAQLLKKDVEEGFKNMADACTRLRHVVCDVDILDQCLLHLARRCSPWRTFRFNLSRVLTHQDEEMASCDGGEDGCDGSATPSLKRLDDDRELGELKMQIEEALGFFDDWKEDCFEDMDMD